MALKLLRERFVVYLHSIWLNLCCCVLIIAGLHQKIEERGKNLLFTIAARILSCLEDKARIV